MRMNFGGGVARLGQGTMINPYFDLWGPFVSEQVRSFRGLVAYYPANFKRDEARKHGMHGTARGFAHGPIGVMSR